MVQGIVPFKTQPHPSTHIHRHAPLPPTSQPLPNFICKLPEFSAQVNSLVCDCGLFDQPHHKQLDLYKLCIREAARRIQLQLLLTGFQGGQLLGDILRAQRMTLATVSKAI